MASATMADLLKQAEEAGISSYEPTNGNYTLEVVRANAGRTKGGDPKFGIQFKVRGGPDDGKSFWTNFNLIATKKDGTPNSTGLAITFRDLAALGASADKVAQWDVDAPNANEQVEAAVKGTVISCEVQVKQSGDYTNINLRNVRPQAPAPSGPAPAPVQGAADGPRPW